MRQAFQTLLALFGVHRDRIFARPFRDRTQRNHRRRGVNPTMAGEDGSSPDCCCVTASLLWCARDVQHKRVYVTCWPRFFVGGIGRLLAVLLDGAPHPF